MNTIKLQFGDVREKSIVTPNQFVSHMIEHIAWRLGAKIQLVWETKNWKLLGVQLGKEIKKFTPKQKQGVALGMIDDGSAEVVIDLNKKGLKLTSVKNINLPWFLNMRCEQLNSGKPLIVLLEGLAEGLGAGFEIKICSFEDPHHTWEGVFRGVGMALNKIFTPQISVQKESSTNKATVNRKTAETQITVNVNFESQAKNGIVIDVDKSTNVKGLDKLLVLITQRAGFSLSIDFKAKVLSSSHVVWEDIGLGLGRALLEVLKIRMEKIGINGAGSNLRRPTDVKSLAVKVGLSVEGRKFLKIFPASQNYQTVRKNLLLGKNIFGNLRSEDLDDFLDGLCGGMGCSLIVVVDRLTKPENFWKSVFAGIGDALKEVFLPNPYRKGATPGVKANLS